MSEEVSSAEAELIEEPRAEESSSAELRRQALPTLAAAGPQKFESPECRMNEKQRAERESTSRRQRASRSIHCKEGNDF